MLRVDGEIAAVALWRLPGDVPLSSAGVPGIAGSMSALLGADRAAAVGDALHAVGGAQPDEPHAYLTFLAVAPDRQRAGLGRRVMEPLLRALRLEVTTRRAAAAPG